MNNKYDKPKLTARQLIAKMKYEKGITFNYISEINAENYLANINNYLRTAAYRKNYQKYLKGIHIGKYIHLDFAYLQELSTLDMHFRFIASKMCLDIEHDLKVKILYDIEHDTSCDGYSIVQNFLTQNPYIIKKLESTCTSPFTSDLIHKYFTIQKIHNPSVKKVEHKIISFANCPVWVLLELLTFGDFIKFYNFYYTSSDIPQISLSILHLVKSLRNACAHNNCIFASLAHGTSKTPSEISQAITQISSIKSNQRQKKLSCRPMLEFVCLLYTYKLVVSPKVKQHRIQELKWLFFERMPQKGNFFKNNQLITSNYDFACKVINAFFQ